MGMVRNGKIALGAGLLGSGLVLWSALAARGAEAMVPADGTFVDVPGARLHYVDTGGDGPVIVMMHGLYGQLRNFSYALTRALQGDYRLILVDRPGWGHSTVTAREQPTIPQQAGMIAAMIDALSLDKPLLVGHSMGGAVALSVALDHADCIRGLALIAPLTRPIDDLPPALKGRAAPAGLRGLVAWTLAVPIGSFTAPAAAKRIFAPDPVPRDFAVRGGGALALRPKSYSAGSFELHDANRALDTMVPRYGAITLPVAILYGRDDRLLDPASQGQRTADAIPGAAMTTIEGGHMVPVTWPVETAAWLRRVATA